MTEVHTHDLLEHIASLRIASREQLGGGKVEDLLHAGLIRQVWIGNYTLTEAGHEARKETPVAAEVVKKRRGRKRKSEQP